jgi:hypothetical protein
MKCEQAGSELKNNEGIIKNISNWIQHRFEFKNESVAEMYENQVQCSTNATEGS